MNNCEITLKYNLNADDYKAAKNLLSAVKRNYLLGKSSSTSFYLKNFSNETEYNKSLIILSNAELIKVNTSAARRWSSIEAGDKLFDGLSNDEINKKKEKLYKKEYSLRRKQTGRNKVLTKTKTKGLLDVGLKRGGFRKCINSSFKLDTLMLKKYRCEIVEVIRKGLIDKPFFDGVDYNAAINIIIDSYIDNPSNSYNLEKLSLDSRGRAIYSCLKKIGNPVGFKVFRSLIVLPEINPGLSNEAEKAIYLFIAELLGYKEKTIKLKLAAGKLAASRKELSKDVADKIWLLRIYDELKRYETAKKKGREDLFYWRVPIELDASASMLGFAGALLGDSSLLTAVNGAGRELSDPWAVGGVSREQVKAATMPRLFGSSKTVRELLAGQPVTEEQTVTEEQLEILDGLLRVGYFAKADKLKTLLISGVTPNEEMRVKIFDDEFTIYCNKFKTFGAVPEKFTLLDSNSKSLVEITRAKVIQEADLDSFRRYFPTLLIHCLDSQAANNVAGKTFKASKFCIPIHDAFIVHPNVAAKVRGWYAAEIDDIYKNREKILADFFSSIGLTPLGYKQVKELLELVEPLPSGWKCRPEILK